ncbi:MAG TPA: CapA family protein [Candidatus Paceibacterota bacterium]|nr:CapA family protein [Candidatus Paceibacterota bacterium]
MSLRREHIIQALLVAAAAAILIFWPNGLQESIYKVEQGIAPWGDTTLHTLFVGDVMLDRNVAVHARQVGDAALFAGVEPLFKSKDMVIGNLEGTITDNQSIAQQDHTILRFTFDPHFAMFLKSVGFTALSQANNHSLDFGNEGYLHTIAYLQAAGIGYFGHALNEENLSLQLQGKGQMLCLVGYMELFRPDPTSVINEIKRLRPLCSEVVVMPHWGVEYMHEPTDAQVSLAHEFIDAGADVIVGGHPHVVEPLEIYNNHAIFYSLGNFLFDQPFSPQVRRGLAVGIDFAATSTNFTLIPTNTYLEASLADATTSQAVMSDVVTDALPPTVAKSIQTTGSFELVK